jgi:hypothetical protein
VILLESKLILKIKNSEKEWERKKLKTNRFTLCLEFAWYLPGLSGDRQEGM